MSETLVLPYEVPVSGITPTAKGIEGGGAACYDSDVLELPNSPLAAAKDQEETNEAGAVRIKTGQPACDGADVLSHSSEALRAASVLAVLAGNLRDNTEDKRVGHQSPGVVDKPGASTTAEERYTPSFGHTTFSYTYNHYRTDLGTDLALQHSPALYHYTDQEDLSGRPLQRSTWSIVSSREFGVDLLVVFASTKRMSTDNIHQIMSQHSGIAGTGIAIL